MNKIIIKKILFINLILIIIYSNLFSNENNNYFYLKRPVPDNIPLIKDFGLFLNKNNQYEMSIIYQFGFNKCIKIDESILAMGEGIVKEVWIDTKVDGYPNKWNKLFQKNKSNNIKYKDGGLIIDYGVHEFIDGESGRVYAKFSNIVPIAKKGDNVKSDTVVAEFSTCDRYGYPPILTIQIILVDEKNKFIHFLGILSKK